MKAIRKGLTAVEIQFSSARIANAVLSLEEITKSSVIMLYRALPGEVDLNSLADTLLTQKKIVLLPKVNGDNLEPRIYSGPESLSKGSFNIMEPDGEVFFGHIDAVVVPGLCFDIAGGRLGFGRGFYDRFLNEKADTFKIGVCFDKLLLDEVPAEPHDKRMDIVLTETKIFRIR